MSANFTPNLTPYTKQGLFVWWAQVVLPTVYSDALSYYECLCKLTQYLNDVIKDVDACESNIDSLSSAFNELQEYVNHYFDSEDMQAKIDAKLDEMVADGVLDSLFNGTLATSNFVDALQTPSVTNDFSVVNEMVATAETYFNYAYTPSGHASGILYESHTGLFSPSLGQNYLDEQYGIVCSSFVEAILRGIRFENSRYRKAVNYPDEYGVGFDHTGEFGRTMPPNPTQDDIDTVNFEINQRYLTSYALCKYAHDHNYLYMIDGYEKIRPGDVLFTTGKYPSYVGNNSYHTADEFPLYPYPTSGAATYAFMGIDHCCIVLNVCEDRLTVIEAWTTAKKRNDDGSTNPVGIQITYDKTASDYICGARFPMGSVYHAPEQVFRETNLSGDTNSNTLVSYVGTLPQGFYTIVAKGTAGGRPYISVPIVASGSDHLDLDRYGEQAYLTFYLQKETTVSFRVESGHEYDFSEVTVYHGYADPLVTGVDAIDYRPYVYGLSEASPLYENDDLNNRTSIGVRYASSTILPTLANKPDGLTDTFRLEIKQINNNENRIMQTIYPLNFTGVWYARQYNNTSWSEWFTYGDTGESIKAVFGLEKSTALQSGSDMNNHKGIGVYYCQSETICNTLLHKPTYLSASFRMEVKKINSNDHRVVQEITALDGSGTKYARQYNGTEWSVWFEYQNTSNNSVRSKIFGIGAARAINANDNLNDKTDVGVYCCEESIIAQSVIMRPTGLSTPFRMEVVQLNSVRIMQKIYPATAEGGFYTRVWSGSSWSSWYHYTGTAVASVGE